MSVGLDEWYKEVWERTIRMEKMLEQVLAALQSAKLITGDKDLFLEGMGEQTTEEEAEAYEAEAPTPQTEEPRSTVSVKDAEGGDTRVPISKLPDDIQLAVELARSMGQMYQVYFDLNGEYRIVTTREVSDRVKREGLG